MRGTVPEVGRLLLFSHSVVSDFLQPHGLSFTISRSLLKLMSIESVMASNHLILCYPLLSWEEQAANTCCSFCLPSWLAYVGWSSILTLAHTIYPLKSWAPKQLVAKDVFH